MNTRTALIDQAIQLHAKGMGNFHSPLFAEYCRSALMQATSLAAVSEDVIPAAVELYAEKYMANVKAERERILAIDAIADQLPAGYAALAKRAKFETLISAEEFAVEALAACRSDSHAVPGRLQ